MLVCQVWSQVTCHDRAAALAVPCQCTLEFVRDKQHRTTLDCTAVGDSQQRAGGAVQIIGRQLSETVIVDFWLLLNAHLSNFSRGKWKRALPGNDAQTTVVLHYLGPESRGADAPAIIRVADEARGDAAGVSLGQARFLHLMCCSSSTKIKRG